MSRRSALRILSAGFAIVFALGTAAAETADVHLAPTGTLRAVYLEGNPAQASQDPQTGAISGIAVDLANGLAKRAGAPLAITPVRGVQGVIDAVAGGSANIGFLANDPSRAGPIVFSETYLRNPQGVLTLTEAALDAIEDIYAPGVKIGVLRGDSIALWMARNKPDVILVLRDANGPSEIDLLKSGAIDGFAGNRLRLSALAQSNAELRMLPGSIMGVPQAIIVKAGNHEGLAAVNAFIDESRANGFLQSSIAKAANGTEMEPAPE